MERIREEALGRAGGWKRFGAQVAPLADHERKQSKNKRTFANAALNKTQAVPIAWLVQAHARASTRTFTKHALTLR